jgi:hypothetical protein
VASDELFDSSRTKKEPMQCKPQNHVEKNRLLVVRERLYNLCSTIPAGFMSCLTHTMIPWHPCSRRNLFQPMRTTRLQWGCAATSEKTVVFGATTEHPRDELCCGTFKRNDRSDDPLDRSDRRVAAVYDHLHIYNLCSNLQKLLGYLLHRLCICDIPIAPKMKYLACCSLPRVTLLGYRL